MAGKGMGKLIIKVIVWIQAAFPLRQAASASDCQAVQRVSAQGDRHHGFLQLHLQPCSTV